MNYVLSIIALLAALAGWVATSIRLRALESRLAPRIERIEVPVPADPAVPPPPTTQRATPTAAPPPSARDPVELRQAVVQVLEELKREEDAKWQERVKKSGVDLLEKALALNPGQVELVTPVVEEHLKAIQAVWWPGTVKNDDGTERALTYDEKLKFSAEARARVDERMRQLLGGAKAAQYDDWVRAWREEAPKRTGEAGPLRWY